MDVSSIKGVGEARLKQLHNLGIFTVDELLTHFPRDYEDRRYFTNISEAILDSNTDGKKIKKQIKATVKKKFFFPSKRGKTLKVIIEDESGCASLLCMNRNFLNNKLNINDKYIFFGNFNNYGNEISSIDFEIIDIDKEDTIKNILPIYPMTEGLNQNFLRKIIKEALNKKNKQIFPDLPDSLDYKENLFNENEALWNIHFPNDFEKLNKAKESLKFYEAFSFLIQNHIQKTNKQKNENFYKCKNSSLIDKFISSLHFNLTDGQKKVWKEIEENLNEDYPMNRLLQGDVGAGKTLVAILSILKIIDNGFQAVLMVPTEVLALQHYSNLQNMLEPLNIRIRLLYGGLSTQKRRQVLFDIENNIAQIVIGTHACFSRDVEYTELGLVVIDEQHKFGIRERIKIIQKGNQPHVLVMTATPLPRTLTLLKYGDLEHSIIPDLPITKRDIKTKILFQKDRLKTWSFIKDKINNENEQAYFVYPRIEKSSGGYFATIDEQFKEIVEYFKPHKCVYLHGKMSYEEKNEVLLAFSEGDISVLLCTTLVEVGIDVSNANIMLIENAEYYGLTQLHQLRGRVGRQGKKAYCFLLTPKDITETGKQRLKAMVNSNNGFELAESDLIIRGPGDYAGMKQSGWIRTQWNDPCNDEKFLFKTQDVIDNWIENNQDDFDNYIKSLSEKSLFYFEQKPFIDN